MGRDGFLPGLVGSKTGEEVRAAWRQSHLESQLAPAAPVFLGLRLLWRIVICSSETEQLEVVARANILARVLGLTGKQCRRHPGPGRELMKIYDFPLSPRCRKVRAIVYELGLTPEFVPVNLFKGEQKRPEIVRLNPNARVPILVDGDFVLWESNAIVNYLASGSALLPESPRERADVARWCDWQQAHLGPAIAKVAFQRLVKPMTGQGDPDPAIVESGTLEYAESARVLDACLGSKEYVAGLLSVADFILAAIHSVAAPAGLDVSPYPRVGAWLERMLGRPSFKLALADAQGATPQ
jgi:glutathione S-transferase